MQQAVPAVQYPAWVGTWLCLLGPVAVALLQQWRRVWWRSCRPAAVLVLVEVETVAKWSDQQGIYQKHAWSLVHASGMSQPVLFLCLPLAIFQDLLHLCMRVPACLLAVLGGRVYV